MPTYDYQCAACGKTYELFQSITESPKKKCHFCGKLRAQRLIGSGGAVIFKGSGFYQTDYRSSEYKKRAKEDSGTSSSSTSTPKTDSGSSSGGSAKESSAPKKD
jgi:putative FmdB family regulatory protein